MAGTNLDDLKSQLREGLNALDYAITMPPGQRAVKLAVLATRIRATAQRIEDAAKSTITPPEQEEEEKE